MLKVGDEVRIMTLMEIESKFDVFDDEFSWKYFYVNGDKVFLSPKDIAALGNTARVREIEQSSKNITYRLRLKNGTGLMMIPREILIATNQSYDTSWMDKAIELYDSISGLPLSKTDKDIILLHAKLKDVIFK